MAIDPKRSALIINDMQVDAIGPEGAFADLGAPEHAKSQNVVEQVNRLADAARKIGMPVIWVVHYETASHADTKTNCAVFKAIVEADSLVKGSKGAELVPGCEPQDGDLIVEKQRMSAFAGTALDAEAPRARCREDRDLGRVDELLGRRHRAPGSRSRLRGRRCHRRNRDHERRVAVRSAQTRARRSQSACPSTR